MFNQNFKVMKQKIFTLVMMLALVFMAGRSFAAVNSTVTKGGTYPYAINGLVLTGTSGTVVAHATISYETGTGATITPSSVALKPDSTDLHFSVAYDSALATSGTIRVVIAYDGGGCSNQITLGITVTKAPTIDLALTASEDQYCQTDTTTANNVAGSSGSTNTMTFTVSQDSLNNKPASYSWGYKITLPNVSLGSFLVKRGGTDVTASIGTGLTETEASGTTSVVYTVTFNTTTGLTSKSLTGTLSAVHLTDLGTGGGSYYETHHNNDSDVVTVKPVPTIGVFH
jgi:hypothetical protein